MMLCDADITTKSFAKKQRYLQNFELVRSKLKELEEKDRIRNWQPPITGELIMQTFNIPAGREVGIIKNAIREAILDGLIKNDYQEAFDYMVQQAKTFNLTPLQK